MLYRKIWHRISIKSRGFMCQFTMSDCDSKYGQWHVLDIIKSVMIDIYTLARTEFQGDSRNGDVGGSWHGDSSISIAIHVSGINVGNQILRKHHRVTSIHSDWLSVSMSLFVSLCLSACLSLCLWVSVSVSLCLSVCLSLFLRNGVKSDTWK